LEIHLEHLVENCSLLSNAWDGPKKKLKLVESKHTKKASSDQLWNHVPLCKLAVVEIWGEIAYMTSIPTPSLCPWVGNGITAVDNNEK